MIGVQDHTRCHIPVVLAVGVGVVVGVIVVTVIVGVGVAVTVVAGTVIGWSDRRGGINHQADDGTGGLRDEGQADGYTTDGRGGCGGGGASASAGAEAGPTDVCTDAAGHTGHVRRTARRRAGAVGRRLGCCRRLGRRRRLGSSHGSGSTAGAGSGPGQLLVGNGEVAIGDVLRRQGGLPLGILDPLLLQLHVAQHRDHHDEDYDAQTAADYQAQSPGQDGVDEAVAGQPVLVRHQAGRGVQRLDVCAGRDVGVLQHLHEHIIAANRILQIWILSLVLGHGHATVMLVGGVRLRQGGRHHQSLFVAVGVVDMEAL